MLIEVTNFKTIGTKYRYLYLYLDTGYFFLKTPVIRSKKKDDWRRNYYVCDKHAVNERINIEFS